MRTRTFVLSFLVHTVMIGAAMVVRIVATTELPDPPRPTSFMMTVADVPEVQPPPAATPAPSTPATAVNTSAVPIVAPDSLVPEARDLPDTVLEGAGVPGSIGDPPGDPLGIGPPVRAAAPAPPVPQPPVRPGGVVRPPQKVHHVAPVYPPIAQAARVSGTVILEALIAEDGSVREVKVLRSATLLDAAAIDAVRQWRFTPTLLNGTPVQVIMSVTVTFTLN